MIVPIFPLRKQSILWKHGSPPQSLTRKMMHLCPTFIASTFGKNIFSSKMFCKSSFVDRELDTFLCVFYTILKYASSMLYLLNFYCRNQDRVGIKTFNLFYAQKIPLLYHIIFYLIQQIFVL